MSFLNTLETYNQTIVNNNHAFDNYPHSSTKLVVATGPLLSPGDPIPCSPCYTLNTLIPDGLTNLPMFSCSKNTYLFLCKSFYS